MDYSMEELIPIVAGLAEKYTAHESTSVTYETAEQLMQAVLYCIRELHVPAENKPAASGKLSARQAYDLGLSQVKGKVKLTLDLYNKLLPTFNCYKNRCLYDTFAKGFPEFFRWYDPEFNPQDTILTLDYPVLKDLSSCTGIDRIYAYADCIRLEQRFLELFPEEYVIDALSRYETQFEDMIENICEIVLISFSGRMDSVDALIEKYCRETDGAGEYFAGTIRDIRLRKSICKTSNR